MSGLFLLGHAVVSQGKVTYVQEFHNTTVRSPLTRRVFFLLQRIRSPPCACAFVALLHVRLAYDHYAIKHSHNAANTRTQCSNQAR